MFIDTMSDKELTDVEYDRMLAESEQPENVSTHSDASENPEEDDIDPQSRPYASRYPAMRKLIEMQRRLTGTVLDDGTEPKDQASCARAWKELEMLRRIMMGKPITVEPGKVKERKVSAPVVMLSGPVDQSQAAA
jgi:hypothetical protein